MRSDLLANAGIGRRAWNERTNLRHGHNRTKQRLNVH